MTDPGNETMALRKEMMLRLREEYDISAWKAMEVSGVIKADGEYQTFDEYYGPDATITNEGGFAMSGNHRASSQFTRTFLRRDDPQGAKEIVNKFDVMHKWFVSRVSLIMSTFTGAGITGTSGSPLKKKRPLPSRGF